MNADHPKYIYGPVPSRRLGRSLGIDLVPFKTCTYDCIYCQLGPTTNKTLERKEYIVIADIQSELERELAGSDAFDYISLAGSGEPTLNSGIGNLIVGIKSMTNRPIAVLTNGSLLWMSEVQDALMAADVVLPSLDAGDKFLFQFINRPHKEISFEHILDGLSGFADRFKGEIWLEVFLLAGITGIKNEVEKIASLIRKIKLKRIQLNTVSRPPSKEFAQPLLSRQMQYLAGMFPGTVEIVKEMGSVNCELHQNSRRTKSEILSMTSRRPCTSTDIAWGLGLHMTEVVKCLDELINDSKVTTTRMNEKIFYISEGRTGALKP
jgi:wyosine [tRNA(Phe)-imidazoG37] synthetase (radical SAM superfamily)